MSEIPSHCIVTKYRKKSVVFGDTDWIDLLSYVKTLAGGRTGAEQQS